MGAEILLSRVFLARSTDCFNSSTRICSSISYLTVFTIPRALPSHKPVVRATRGSFSGPMTSSAIIPMRQISKKPISNMLFSVKSGCLLEEL